VPIVSVQFFLGSPSARTPYSAVSLTEILLISGGIGKSCVRRVQRIVREQLERRDANPARLKHTLMVVPKQIGIHKIVRDNNEKLGILALLGAREGLAKG
jgi:hypothetical protein